MSKANINKIVAIVRDAGGQIVGRTRLQKIAYLLTSAGLEDGLVFSYKHFGPYSEALANAARDSSLLRLVTETKHQAGWGGTYSTYVVPNVGDKDMKEPRCRLASEAAAADAVELELAATAVFLANEGYDSPWDETTRRKPEKASAQRLKGAKDLYRRLSAIETPKPLPQILQ